MLIDEHGTTIQIDDKDACCNIIDIQLSNDQLAAILSRQARVECDLNVYNLDDIGKKHESKDFEFEIPNNLVGSENAEKLHIIATELLTNGWLADRYFSSQRSFFKRDGKQYASCVIRRWI